MNQEEHCYAIKTRINQMKHLILSFILSGALLADAIILEEYTIENTEGYKSTDVKILCMNGYEWVHSRIYSMIEMNQVFIENKDKSVPKQCNMDFKHSSQLYK